MASERIIDLENQRYADREVPDAAVIVPDPEEAARAERQQAALSRLRRRVREKPGPRTFLALADLTDLLIVLGLDDW